MGYYHSKSDDDEIIDKLTELAEAKLNHGLHWLYNRIRKQEQVKCAACLQALRNVA